MRDFEKCVIFSQSVWIFICSSFKNPQSLYDGWECWTATNGNGNNHIDLKKLTNKKLVIKNHIFTHSFFP